MRTLNLVKKDARILVTGILPVKRAQARKEANTGEYRLWSKFAAAVDDALGEYGEIVYIAIDQATNEVNRLALDGESGRKSRDDRRAEQEERVAEINAQLNARVRELDDEQGGETVEIELTDGLHKWLSQTWELPGGFDDSRESRRRFMLIDEAIRQAGKADEEPVALRRSKR